MKLSYAFQIRFWRETQNRNTAENKEVAFNEGHCESVYCWCWVAVELLRLVVALNIKTFPPSYPQKALQFPQHSSKRQLENISLCLIHWACHFVTSDLGSHCGGDVSRAEDGRSIFLRNIRIYQVCTALQPTRPTWTWVCFALTASYFWFHVSV